MKLSTLTKGKRLVTLACMAAVLSVGLVFGPVSQSALAVTCHEQALYPSTGSATVGGKTYQQLINAVGNPVFTTPGVQGQNTGCQYINVKNITGGWGTGGHCWSFRVFSYTTNTWYPEMGPCAGPTDVAGIAGPVQDLTDYSVFIIPNANLRVTLRD